MTIIPLSMNTLQNNTHLRCKACGLNPWNQCVLILRENCLLLLQISLETYIKHPHSTSPQKASVPRHSLPSSDAGWNFIHWAEMEHLVFLFLLLDDVTALKIVLWSLSSSLISWTIGHTFLGHNRENNFEQWGANNWQYSVLLMP